MLSGEWRNRLHRWGRDALALYLGIRDPSVPLLAKIALVMPVVYLMMPMDVIPDIIPIIGWLDDLAMIPLACYLAQRLLPYGVMARLREQADTRLLRWGPKYKLYAVVFLAVWLLLAGWGGMSFYRSMRARPPVQQNVSPLYRDLDLSGSGIE